MPWVVFGEEVSDRTLVLNVIRGLNEKFTHIGVHLRHGRPFPTFLEARNELLLEELTVGKPTTNSSTAPRLCAWWLRDGRQSTKPPPAASSHQQHR
jgi:hypothetical protein